MPEENPIRRLQRRLSHPSTIEFTPATEAVASDALLHEIAEVAAGGGLGRRLAPAYALITIATTLICMSSREEPGGLPPQDFRDPGLAPLALSGADDELVSIPPVLMRKILRWGKDHLPRIRAELRREAGPISEHRLRFAIFVTLDRDWERYKPEFELMARMFPAA